MSYDLIVIGGGPSGMMAAGHASELGLKTLLLERNNRLGKKLLITGKGRCNLTNAGNLESFIQSYGKNGRFLYRALGELSNEDLVAFFNRLGVKTKIERGGRIFPESDRSEEIVDALTKYLNQNKCEIRLSSRVQKVTKEDSYFKIELENGSRFESGKLIIAAGGLSYPQTGSTGDGYEFAKGFGHKITDLSPALVPLETKESFVKNLQGLSLKNVKVSLLSDGSEIASEFGEMLFTHFGVSGPIILTLSGTAGEEIKKRKKVTLSINFKPALNEEILTQRLIRELDLSGKSRISNILKNLLPKALIPVFLSLAKIPAEKLGNQINRDERQKLYDLLTDFRLEATKTRGYDEAIITKGGLPLKEIDPYTMESKKIKGLFFCGEVLDIEGFTGGYNLQEAFSTGYLAAKGAGIS